MSHEQHKTGCGLFIGNRPDGVPTCTCGLPPSDATQPYIDALGAPEQPQAPTEVIGWQWRRTGQQWPEKWLHNEPELTAPDTEKRTIYAGPTVAYGVRVDGEGQPDELRRAVQQMTEALKNQEWAEHVSRDPDATELECAITKLIGRTLQPRRLTEDEIGALWRELSTRGHANNWNDFWNVVRFTEQAIHGVKGLDE